MTWNDETGLHEARPGRHGQTTQGRTRRDQARQRRRHPARHDVTRHGWVTQAFTDEEHMKETYKMKDGSRYSIDPEVAAATLRDLGKRHGAIRPNDLVNEASDENHPLHSAFDWDDTSAAHKYRLVQARQLIRSVEVTWEEPKGPRNVNAVVRSGRAFVNTTRDGTGYEPIQQVLSNEEKRLRLLEQALEDLVEVQNRYQSLQELAGVRVAIGEYAKKVNDYERRNVKKPQARRAA